jgi:PBSX family phage terminase large subunit
MKLKKLSPKQRDFLLHSTARINVAYGSVRSGKTIATLLRWLYIVATCPEGSGLLMCAKTERTLKRNILDVIAEIVGPDDFDLRSGVGECYIYGKKVYLVGANDERSENKIRGITLYAAYLDEATLYPESFFQMLLSRLSVENAILILTTNPDSPYHYLKTKFIDREGSLNLKCWHFLLEDNLTLPPDYVESLKAEYIPGSVWYKRYILGEFALAEGSVYPFFSTDINDGYVIDTLPTDFSRYRVSMDYGQQHPTVMGLAGYSPSRAQWIVIREFFTNNKTNTEYSVEFGKEILGFNGGIVPDSIDIDSGGGGLSLIYQLRKDYPTLRVRHAIKVDVSSEIQSLANALFTHKIVLYGPGCPKGIPQLANYVYDDKAKDRGKDEPLKRDDDFCDMLRYLNNRVVQSG